MKNFKNPIFYGLFCLSLFCYSQDAKQLFKDFKTDTYAVGFKLIETFDNSRIYQYNKESKKYTRPMQIGVWYPSIKNSKLDLTLKNKRATLQDYMQFAARSESLIKNDSLEKSVIKEFLNAGHINKIKANEILNISTSALLFSQPLKGKFPLVIVAPGSSAEFYDNFMLCEYLASKGYVVMSSKSRGFRVPTMNARWSGVESQTRDMEYIMAEATKHDFVDVNKINTIGRSWGAIAALVFSIRNKEVTQSITSLDGTLSYNAIDLMKDSEYPSGEFVYRPIFLAVGKKRAETATPIDRINYFKNVKYTNAYKVEYNEMRHTAFSSYYLLNHYLLNKGIDEKTATDLIKGYLDNIQHVGDFLDFHNKKGSKSEWFVSSTEDYSFDLNKAQETLPPNYEDFGYALTVNGVDSAISVYEEAFKINAQYANKELFSANYINGIAYQHVANNRLDSAIKLIKMALQAFPENANLYDTYGEFLLSKGNKKESLKAYKRALELNPSNENAKKIIKEIEH